MADQKKPRFRGKQADTLRITFAGADDDLGMVFDVGEEVVMVVRGRAKTGNFKEDQFGGIVLQQQIKVDHAMIADDDLYQRMRDEMKRREDEAAGQTSLDSELDGDESADLAAVEDPTDG